MSEELKQAITVSIAYEVSGIKEALHRLAINNVNNITKKQFDILREVEVKLNDFISEDK